MIPRVGEVHTSRSGGFKFVDFYPITGRFYTSTVFPYERWVDTYREWLSTV